MYDEAMASSRRRASVITREKYGVQQFRFELLTILCSESAKSSLPPPPTLSSARDLFAIGRPATFDDSGLHTIPNSVISSIGGSAGYTPRDHTPPHTSALSAVSEHAAASSSPSTRRCDLSPPRRPSLNLPPAPPLYDPAALTTRSESAAAKQRAAVLGTAGDADKTPRSESVATQRSAASAAAAALSGMLSSAEVPFTIQSFQPHSRNISVQITILSAEKERLLLQQQQQINDLQARVQQLQQQLHEAKTKIAVQDAMLHPADDSSAGPTKEIPVVERCVARVCASPFFRALFLPPPHLVPLRSARCDATGADTAASSCGCSSCAPLPSSSSMTKSL
jgi:hypothetical protein